jgi:hypothetical protein
MNRPPAKNINIDVSEVMLMTTSDHNLPHNVISQSDRLTLLLTALGLALAAAGFGFQVGLELGCLG